MTARKRVVMGHDGERVEVIPWPLPGPRAGVLMVVGRFGLGSMAVELTEREIPALVRALREVLQASRGGRNEEA